MMGNVTMYCMFTIISSMRLTKTSMKQPKKSVVRVKLDGSN